MKICLSSLAIVIGVTATSYVGSCHREPPSDEELTAKIRKKIQKVSRSQDLADYTGTISEADDATYEMVFIEGGSFTMGSPAEEPNRAVDEGPQYLVSVGSFWMGKYEVTWDQYGAFWSDIRANHKAKYEGKNVGVELHDLISAPSQMEVPDYTDMSLGMGNSEEYPAVRMSQYGAKKFCQWLSAQTGHFYRLPTEAEWEYACRAGTTGAYSCNESELADFAVFDPNQTRVGYAKVGTKKPNPWGLYDIHGNVFEWVSDRYDPELYQRRTDAGNTFTDPIAWPREGLPRVMRGGSWYDPAEDLRSANREFPDRAILNLGQEAKSKWWISDAFWLGFRIVRPVEIPSAEFMHDFWNQ